MKATKENSFVLSARAVEAIDTGIKVYFVHTAGKKANYDVCPFGTVGSLLWVQEPHQYLHAYPEDEDGAEMVVYKFSQEVRHAPLLVRNAAAQAAIGDTDPFTTAVGATRFGWSTPNRAARQLPDWASRLTLRIAEITYVALQDLSCDTMRLDLGLAGYTDEQLVRKYVSYWDGCHRDGYRWVSNPIVWVVGFVPIWKNISKI